MDMTIRPEDLAFRDQVRAFIQTALPESLRKKAEADAHFDHHEVMQWHKILYHKGWVAPHWPKEYGGPGLSVTQRFLLTEELELAGVPTLSPFGLYMVGPLLIQFGSEAQKQRFLPKILSGEEVWCQGYSEPSAGSDLASLRTAARQDDAGHFVVTGQKTWTTYAQYADWIFALVRTDAGRKKQEGISFLLIDMKSPGLTVKPFLTLGGTPAFCETFFDEVVVPRENLVGPLHGGWTVAKALLGHERTLIATVGHSERAIRRAKRIALATHKNGRPLLDDPAFRNKIARLEIRLRGLQMSYYRAIAGAQHGRAPGPESSFLKIRGSEILQQCYELLMELLGENSLSWWNEPGVVPDNEQYIAPLYCYNRATTIYGGSNEIQRNIIAKLLLGLG
jgi:alkylation response protein AidB-like acyl-CoA dehydrogenase